MKRFTNILYASHGTADETEGLKQALSVARNDDAALRVLIVSPPFPSDLLDHKRRFEEALLDQAKASVASTRAELGLSDDDVAIDIDLVSDKKPSVRIVRELMRGGHDLLVKEAELPERGEGFWAIDMDLLRTSPRPVWLSRPIHRSREEIRVAVAIDAETTSESSRALSINLLRLAQSLADTCSGELHIVSCSNYPQERFLRNNPWVKMAGPEVKEAIAEAMEKGRAVLNELIAEAAIVGKQNLHHVRGEPVDKIPEFVEREEIDILVMGTLARTGIPGFFIGNTAENVMQSLDCSLVALKPTDFDSPVKIG